ncbi:hypothetical protein MY04_05725 (plasmid) [Flammeovirga sp. MY04]|uniref:hypothetical protein n=1 Tax=Flammeovirga sp. MY04 TaxID=1191459 RepID=UPI0008061E8F|nr:hypothetical protein [Flammeovirga sp. MY04]ANQ52875.1 hypothetical protein MY04_05725 [Flammeovirga sp. MY04]
MIRKLYILLVIIISSCNQELFDKVYKGPPFVSLSDEQQLIKFDQSVQQKKIVWLDSILINEPIDIPIIVSLNEEISKSKNNLGVRFRFQDKVKINAGASYGYYTIDAEIIDEKLLSKSELVLYIEKVDNDLVIPGLQGIKKENEKRQPHYKSYFFKQ